MVLCTYFYGRGFKSIHNGEFELIRRRAFESIHGGESLN